MPWKVNLAQGSRHRSPRSGRPKELSPAERRERELGQLNERVSRLAEDMKVLARHLANAQKTMNAETRRFSDIRERIGKIFERGRRELGAYRDSSLARELEFFREEPVAGLTEAISRIGGAVKESGGFLVALSAQKRTERRVGESVLHELGKLLAEEEQSNKRHDEVMRNLEQLERERIPPLKKEYTEIMSHAGRLSADRELKEKLTSILGDAAGIQRRTPDGTTVGRFPSINEATSRRTNEDEDARFSLQNCISR